MFVDSTILLTTMAMNFLGPIIFQELYLAYIEYTQQHFHRSSEKKVLTCPRTHSILCYLNTNQGYFIYFP